MPDVTKALLVVTQDPMKLGLGNQLANMGPQQRKSYVAQRFATVGYLEPVEYLAFQIGNDLDANSRVFASSVRGAGVTTGYGGLKKNAPDEYIERWKTIPIPSDVDIPGVGRMTVHGMPDETAARSVSSRLAALLGAGPG